MEELLKESDLDTTLSLSKTGFKSLLKTGLLVYATGLKSMRLLDGGMKALLVWARGMTEEGIMALAAEPFF